MKQIKLNGKYATDEYAVIDDQYFDEISKYIWFLSPQGYVRRDKKINGISYAIFLHKLILNTPKGFDTDHINGNKLDNRRSNLRICKHKDNSRNAKKRIDGVTSRYIGVHYAKDRKKWVSKINVNSKRFSIGEFDKEIWAAMARDLWAKELFGKFAKLNF